MVCLGGVLVFVLEEGRGGRGKKKKLLENSFFLSLCSSSSLFSIHSSPASRKSRRATMYAGGAEDFEVKRRSAFIHAADRATIRLEKRAAYFR